jgi:plastocyanin
MRIGRSIAVAIVVVGVLVVAVAAFALTLGNSLGETAAGDVRSGAAADAATRLEMQDDLFEPASVDVAAGTPVEIEVHNAGQANHNLTSEGLHVSTGPMEPGDVMTVTVTLPAGTTQFVCTWHQGMVVDVAAA